MTLAPQRCTVDRSSPASTCPTRPSSTRGSAASAHDSSDSFSSCAIGHVPVLMRAGRLAGGDGALASDGSRRRRDRLSPSQPCSRAHAGPGTPARSRARSTRTTRVRQLLAEHLRRRDRLVRRRRWPRTLRDRLSATARAISPSQSRRPRRSRRRRRSDEPPERRPPFARRDAGRSRRSPLLRSRSSSPFGQLAGRRRRRREQAAHRRRHVDRRRARRQLARLAARRTAAHDRDRPWRHGWRRSRRAVARARRRRAARRLELGTAHARIKPWTSRDASARAGRSPAASRRRRAATCSTSRSTVCAAPSRPRASRS